MVTIAKGSERVARFTIMSNSVSVQLAALIDPEAVVDAARLPEYAIGSFVPVAAVRPADADGVAAVMAWAHRRGVAVYPSGGRTLAQLGNNPARPGIALDLTRLNRLRDFQPADLTVSVEAGMTIAQLDAALAQDGKHVPIAAPLAQRATIGGTLATGISGPLRAAYGLPRDWLIGVSVVGADGTATKAGGKVVKNVTGYDLNRLYTGSMGTLAVITEATFKLAPAPTDWAVIVAAFADTVAAADAGRNLQSQYYAPLGLHILTAPAAQRLAPPPVNAGGAIAIAVVAGRPASVNRRVNDTAALWGRAAGSLAIARGDDAVSLITALADLPADPAAPPAVCVRVNAPPAALDDILALGQIDLVDSPPAIVADVGFGGGRLLWWNDFLHIEPAELAAGLRQIQAAAVSLGGDAIVERCPAAARSHIDVWGTQPSGITIMRRLKQQFDPDNILNPGRFIGGL